MPKILVVDDELFYRELVCGILQKEGYDVVTAKNASEALQLADEHELCLAILDIVLPGGTDGLLVLSKLKLKYPNVPVIMLTAYEDHKLVLDALRRGAFDYQKKPISAQELRHVVKLALERYRLLKEKETKLKKLSSLEHGVKRLSDFVSSSINLTELEPVYDMLKTTLELVSETLDCERVSIMLLEPDKSRLRVVVSKGMSRSLIKEESREPRKSVGGWVLEHNEAVLVRDIREDKRFEESRFSGDYKTRSFVIAPLVVGEEVVGVISANDKRDLSSFDEDDLMLLKTFSSQVSLTLRHLQILQELEKEKERLKNFVKLEHILLKELQPDVMLKRMLKICQEIMNVSCSSIFLKAPEDDYLVLHTGFVGDEEIRGGNKIQLGESITGWVAKNGKSVIVNKLPMDTRFDPKIEGLEGIKCKNMLVSAIKVSGEVVGVLRLVNKVGGGFGEKDKQFFDDIAKNVALALRNLDLYEKLKKSVDEIVEVNKKLERTNRELLLKEKELDFLRTKLRERMDGKGI